MIGRTGNNLTNPVFCFLQRQNQSKFCNSGLLAITGAIVALRQTWLLRNSSQTRLHAVITHFCDIFAKFLLIRTAFQHTAGKILLPLNKIVLTESKCCIPQRRNLFAWRSSDDGKPKCNSRRLPVWQSEKPPASGIFHKRKLSINVVGKTILPTPANRYSGITPQRTVTVQCVHFIRAHNFRLLLRKLF